jgi:CrcB protein
MTVILVVLGAAVGAPLRYITDRLLLRRHDSAFPWGTFTVNVAGSALLGLLVAAGASAPVQALLGTGFCGALTTYSTFSYEMVLLARSGARAMALLNVVASVTGCFGAAYFGMAIAQAVR